MPGAPRDGGFIKLWRSTLESEIAHAPLLHRCLWMWILLKANYRDHGPLKRGQLFATIGEMTAAMSYKAGRRTISPTRDQVRYAYTSLMKTHMITHKGTTRGLLITVCNYDKYQGANSDDPHTQPHAQSQPIRKEGTEKEVKNAASKTTRPRSPKKTNPEIRRFLDFWTEEHTRLYGWKPLIRGGKDGKIVQDLLNTFELDRLQQMARTFLRSKDQFVETAGHTIGVFSSRANTLAKQSQPAPAARLIPTAEALRLEGQK